jgi:type I restriction enzyme S subunit
VREPSAKYLAALFKLTEAGEIPIDWLDMPIGAIAEVSSGGTPSRKVPSFWNGDIPWVTTAELDGGEIKEATQFISAAGLQSSAAKWLPAGTLLVALYGQGKTRGKCAALRIAATTNQACAAIRLVDGVDSEFVRQNLTHRYDYIRSLSNGGSQENLSGAIVKQIRVGMPPTLTEQQRIAGALSDTDALIDSLRQLLTKKRQIKQGAMQEMLSGKRRLPGFHDDWSLQAMGDLFEFSGGFSASRDQLGDAGICYLHYGDIHLSNKTYIDVDAEQHEMPRLNIDLNEVSKSMLLKAGDVIFVDASEDDEGVSKHVVIHSSGDHNLISGLHTIVARPKSTELVDLYKRYCFQASDVRAQFKFFAVGTKVSGVSKGNIGKITLAVPSPSEQIQIAECLCNMDGDIAAIEARLTKARTLKQAMAQALLTGRIRLVETTA